MRLHLRRAVALRRPRPPRDRGQRDPDLDARPLPGRGLDVAPPPRISARSRMPMSPQCWRPSPWATALGSKPFPSSSMSIDHCPPSTPTWTSTAAACAWRATLLIASWHDPEERRLHLRRQPRQLAELAADGDARAREDPLGVPADGREEPEVVEDRRAQVEDEPVHVLERRGPRAPSPRRGAARPAPDRRPAPRSIPMASTARPWVVSSCSSRAIRFRSSSCAVITLRRSWPRASSRSLSCDVRVGELPRPLLDAPLELLVRLGDVRDERGEVLAHPLEGAAEPADLVRAEAPGWARPARRRRSARRASVRTATGAVTLRAAPQAKTPARAHCATRPASDHVPGERALGRERLLHGLAEDDAPGRAPDRREGEVLVRAQLDAVLRVAVRAAAGHGLLLGASGRRIRRRTRALLPDPGAARCWRRPSRSRPRARPRRSVRAAGAAASARSPAAPARKDPPATPTTSPLPAPDRDELVDHPAARAPRRPPRAAAGPRRAPPRTSGRTWRGRARSARPAGSSASTPLRPRRGGHAASRWRSCWCASQHRARGVVPGFGVERARPRRRAAGAPRGPR